MIQMLTSSLIGVLGFVLSGFLLDELGLEYPVSSVVRTAIGAVCVILTLSSFSIGKDTEDEQVSDYWTRYGEQLKKSYSSKFGGENTGFNDEVDIRVRIMNNQRSGFTRATAKSWLKRMHDFTEAKRVPANADKE